MKHRKGLFSASLPLPPTSLSALVSRQQQCCYSLSPGSLYLILLLLPLLHWTWGSCATRAKAKPSFHLPSTSPARRGSPPLGNRIPSSLACAGQTVISCHWSGSASLRFLVRVWLAQWLSLMSHWGGSHWRFLWKPRSLSFFGGQQLGILIVLQAVESSFRKKKNLLFQHIICCRNCTLKSLSLSLPHKITTAPPTAICLTMVCC